MGEEGIIPIFPPNPGRLSTIQPPKFLELTEHISLSSWIGPPSALGSLRWWLPWWCGMEGRLDPVWARSLLAVVFNAWVGRCSESQIQRWSRIGPLGNRATSYHQEPQPLYGSLPSKATLKKCSHLVNTSQGELQSPKEERSSERKWKWSRSVLFDSLRPRGL